MRSKQRAVVIRAFVGIFVGILGVNCILPEARADDAPSASRAPRPFGDPGMLVLPDVVGIELAGLGERFDVLGIGASHTAGTCTASADVGCGQTRRYNTQLVVSGAADVFVARRLSLGAELLLSLSDSNDNVGATNGPGPFRALARIGYAFPITDDISFWPKLHLGAANFPGGEDITVSPVAVLDSGFVFRASRHVIASLSPKISFYDDVAGGAISATYVELSAQADVGLVF